MPIYSLRAFKNALNFAKGRGSARSRLIGISTAFQRSVASLPRLAKIDIVDWLFTLPEAEYLACCPPDHIAAGVTKTDDGRRMSINVEMIGTGLVVQHYVAEVARPDCRKMVSISDVFTAKGRRTQTQVVWELSAKATDDDRTEYTNTDCQRDRRVPCFHRSTGVDP